jgi:hypothetical protein
MRSWWSAATEDILGGDLDGEREIDYHLHHPHRRPLGTAARGGRGRERRAGMVAARPAHCLSPVRGGRPVESSPARLS